MPSAPDPITSPPAQPWQPYDATAPGAAEDQVTSATIYNSVGGDQAGGPWRKIQEAGAAGSNAEATADSWPGNGASSDGGWKQV
jgi:hypothetical protein